MDRAKALVPQGSDWAESGHLLAGVMQVRRETPSAAQTSETCTGRAPASPR